MFLRCQVLTPVSTAQNEKQYHSPAGRFIINTHYKQQPLGARCAAHDVQKAMNTKLMQRKQFVKLASGLKATPSASLIGGTAAAQANTSPLRMLTIVESYGIPEATRKGTWVISTAGHYALTRNKLGTILGPRAAYKDNLPVCTGNSVASLGTTSDHLTHEPTNQ